MKDIFEQKASSRFHPFHAFQLNSLFHAAISPLRLARRSTESLAILLGRYVKPPGESRSHMRGVVKPALERDRLERSICFLKQPSCGVDSNLLDKRGRCHFCILRE